MSWENGKKETKVFKVTYIGTCAPTKSQVTKALIDEGIDDYGFLEVVEVAES
jgi:hypothetical protein